MMTLRARIISFVIGLVILGIVSFLVRRRKLYNIYAITWFMISIAFLIMGIFSNIVETVAGFLGIYSTPAAVLMVVVGGLGGILLHLSMIVTEQHKQIRNFEKEIAILKIRQP